MPLPPILHEDDTLIAFDNALTACPHGRRSAVMARSPRIGELHRAGRNTARKRRTRAPARRGHERRVLLFAKTKVALDFLSGQFQSKTAQMKYFALVTMLPAERALKDVADLRAIPDSLPDIFTIELSLRDDEREPGRLRVGKGRDSRETRTEFRTLERFGRFLWLECRPGSSRPHQVRVHLGAVGAPVLNDSFYGDPEIKLLLSDLKRGYKGRNEEKPLLTRLALHAGELTVKHPTDARADHDHCAPVPRPDRDRAELPAEIRARTRQVGRGPMNPPWIGLERAGRRPALTALIEQTVAPSESGVEAEDGLEVGDGFGVTAGKLRRAFARTK